MARVSASATAFALSIDDQVHDLRDLPLASPSDVQPLPEMRNDISSDTDTTSLATFDDSASQFEDDIGLHEERRDVQDVSPDIPYPSGYESDRDDDSDSIHREIVTSRKFKLKIAQDDDDSRRQKKQHRRARSYGQNPHGGPDTPPQKKRGRSKSLRNKRLGLISTAVQQSDSEYDAEAERDNDSELSNEGHYDDDHDHGREHDQREVLAMYPSYVKHEGYQFGGTMRWVPPDEQRTPTQSQFSTPKKLTQYRKNSAPC